MVEVVTAAAADDDDASNDDDESTSSSHLKLQLTRGNKKCLGKSLVLAILPEI